MPILIPPAIFDKEDAVFDLPMVACMRQQLIGADLIGANTRQKVACIGEEHGAVLGRDVAIDAQRDLAAGKAQLLADVPDVV